MIPVSVNGTTCEELASRARITPELAVRVMLAGAYFLERSGVGLQLISGYRTAEQQAELEREGRPAAPDELSTHRSCPATGADLRPEVAVTPSLKVILGEAAMRSGLRWGGGSPRDRDGIPVDWNHVDLGPRRS